MICVGRQKVLAAIHLQFENDFAIGHLNRSKFTELLENMNSERGRKEMVMKLYRSLYSLAEAAKVWNDLLIESFALIELKELESAPCILSGNNTTLICYIDDLIVFAKSKRVIDSIDQKVRKAFSIKSLESLKSC